MKKLLLVIAAIATIATSTAQDKPLTWGLKAGFSWSTFRGADQSLVDSKPDFQGGAFIHTQCTDWLGVQFELLYMGQGAKDKVSGEKLNLSYLTVPVLAKFYVAKGLALNAGVQVGYLLGSKLTGSDLSSSEVRSDLALHRFDIAIPLGVSYQFDMGLMLDFRYAIGVTPVYEGWARDNMTTNQNFTLSVGYRF